MAHGLNCSAACGIFLDQGSNPCPPHWQLDSFFFLNFIFLYSRFLLVIYFIHISVYMSIPISQFIPPPPPHPTPATSPPWCQHVCSLHLCGRWILNHCTTSEAPQLAFLKEEFHLNVFITDFSVISDKILIFWLVSYKITFV